jgi:hypothetical protein
MTVAIACPTADGAVHTASNTNTPVRLMGWSVRENGGNALSIDLKEGSASGKVIATIRLAANAGETVSIDDGLVCNSHILYADVTGTSPTPVGSIWIA